MIILKYTIQYYYISLTSTTNNIVRGKGEPFFLLGRQGGGGGLSLIDKTKKTGKSDLIDIYCNDQN